MISQTAGTRVGFDRWYMASDHIQPVTIMMTDRQSQPIWELLRNGDRPLLSYYDKNRLRTLSLDLVQASFDGTLWFPVLWYELINRNLRVNDPVCLLFKNSKNGVQVCLSGTVNFTRDSGLFNKLWGHSDSRSNSLLSQSKSDYVLLEISIDQAESWSLSDGSYEVLFRDDWHIYSTNRLS